MSQAPEGLPVVEGAYEASDAHLKKDISLFGLIALAVSIQVGSGWLLATLAAASLAGPASILTWVLGAVFFAIIGVTWMELGAMLPRSGAGVRYPQLTHGAFLNWINGWGYLIATLSLPVIEAQAVLTYVGGHWPQLGLLEKKAGITVLSWPTGTVAGFALLFLFFLLNSFGAKLLSESNKYVTIWKLVIPLVTAGLMFTAFNSANFTIGGGFAPWAAARSSVPSRAAASSSPTRAFGRSSTSVARSRTRSATSRSRSSSAACSSRWSSTSCSRSVSSGRSTGRPPGWSPVTGPLSSAATGPPPRC